MIYQNWYVLVSNDQPVDVFKDEMKVYCMSSIGTGNTNALSCDEDFEEDAETANIPMAGRSIQETDNHSGKDGSWLYVSSSTAVPWMEALEHHECYSGLFKLVSINAFAYFQ